MDRGLTIQKRQTKTTTTITVITILLLLLWIPVTVDKLISLASFKAAMFKQPIPLVLRKLLVYAIPVLELFTTLLLIFKKSRLAGFYFSLMLMLLFTCYVGLILLGAWKTIPCGCGAVISGMSWSVHFLFNFSFLTLSAYGIYLLKKQRGASHQ